MVGARLARYIRVRGKPGGAGGVAGGGDRATAETWVGVGVFVRYRRHLVLRVRRERKGVLGMRGRTK